MNLEELFTEETGLSSKENPEKYIVWLQSKIVEKSDEDNITKVEGSDIGC